MIQIRGTYCYVKPTLNVIKTEMFNAGFKSQ